MVRADGIHKMHVFLLFSNYLSKLGKRHTFWHWEQVLVLWDQDINSQKNPCYKTGKRHIF